VDRNERMAAVAAEVGQVLQAGLGSLYEHARGNDIGSIEVRVEQV